MWVFLGVVGGCKVDGLTDGEKFVHVHCLPNSILVRDLTIVSVGTLFSDSLFQYKISNVKKEFLIRPTPDLMPKRRIGGYSHLQRKLMYEICTMPGDTKGYMLRGWVDMIAEGMVS